MKRTDQCAMGDNFVVFLTRYVKWNGTKFTGGFSLNPFSHTSPETAGAGWYFCEGTFYGINLNKDIAIVKRSERDPDALHCLRVIEIGWRLRRTPQSVYLKPNSRYNLAWEITPGHLANWIVSRGDGGRQKWVIYHTDHRNNIAVRKFEYDRCVGTFVGSIQNPNSPTGKSASSLPLLVETVMVTHPHPVGDKLAFVDFFHTFRSKIRIVILNKNTCGIQRCLEVSTKLPGNVAFKRCSIQIMRVS